jgi:hypothetical protein
MGGRWAWVLAAGALAGCAGEPERPAGTGAEAAVRGYYEALLRHDWGAAYAALAPEDRARVSAEQFTALARNYWRRLGFEPQGVRVRACEEHGAEAVAHVTLMGRAGARQRFHKDAVTLRRGPAAWGVVLPPRFGR